MAKNTQLYGKGASTISVSVVFGKEEVHVSLAQRSELPRHGFEARSWYVWREDEGKFCVHTSCVDKPRYQLNDSRTAFAEMALRLGA